MSGTPRPATRSGDEARCDAMAHADDEAVVNPSANPTLSDVLRAQVTRRMLLGGGLAVAATSFLMASPARRLAAFTPTPVAWHPPVGPAAAGGLLGFAPVAIPMAADGTAARVDEVLVPAGYTAEVLVSWGDPIFGAGPVFRQDASNTAEDQERQWGSHNDGMHFFPLERGSSPIRRGLLVANHEYTDEMLLHVAGVTPWTAEKVRKSQAAHGVAVVDLRRTGQGQGWRVHAPSPYARRITASTPCDITGPARGHDLMKTRLNPAGTTVLGTFNNCANGHTPWGTYLTCEENFNNYFAHADDPAANDKTSLAGRYGIGAKPEYRWFEHDPRFDAKANPNEPNRFGWVVEIDPNDPASSPAKRTALGRLKHESAAVTEAIDGRVVVYMGDDQAHEYLYKFVGSAPWKVLRAQGKDPL
ncbi:MAG: PhoX family protein, partial [Acidimicrobiia bacterium]